MKSFKLIPGSSQTGVNAGGGSYPINGTVQGWGSQGLEITLEAPLIIRPERILSVLKSLALKLRESGFESLVVPVPESKIPEHVDSGESLGDEVYYKDCGDEGTRRYKFYAKLPKDKTLDVAEKEIAAMAPTAYRFSSTDHGSRRA